MINFLDSLFSKFFFCGKITVQPSPIHHDHSHRIFCCSIDLLSPVAFKIVDSPPKITTIILLFFHFKMFDSPNGYVFIVKFAVTIAEFFLKLFQYYHFDFVFSIDCFF